MERIWVLLGASSACLSVILGAFGAHALRDSLSERSLAIYQTATQYQFYHALALILLGLWGANHSSGLTTATGWLFALGTLIFSGSLYALAITDIKILGAVTPLGGLSFIAGWLCLAISVWRSSP